MARLHTESHRTQTIGWLRAAVLGANDGIVSTASLIIGVAAADATQSAVLVAGVAGLVAGEYVSVSSQSDTEQADIARERQELATDSDSVRETNEPATVYMQRGLDADLAEQVARQLMAKDALGAHTRDELGISEVASAKPVQAAGALASAFSVGAALPLLSAWLSPDRYLLGDRHRIAAVSGGFGRSGRLHRRRQHPKGHLARGVLGCAGDGDHGRGRPAVRSGGMNPLGAECIDGYKSIALQTLGCSRNPIPFGEIS
jgi:VIT1/CCC1 family predicted Fe2+/Mn2+ transporter